ncbi:MAG: hypothetical protein GY862_00990 [Gammaproteobacteria bacterium]|nr:hypothetical protein [Gammaproteobacteria bacterium]
MSFGISEYNAWLSDPEAERILLAIVRYYDDVSEKFAYFSSGEYQTEPDDSLPNIAFDPRLIGDPSITLSVPWLGDAKGEDDFSDIEITNVDAELDNWRGFLFSGRGITLLLGAPDWPYENFLCRPLLQGVIDSVEFGDDDTISLSVRDRMGDLDGSIQESLLSGGPKEGEPVPLSWGIVRNAEPILVDPNDAGGLYQWHDGQVFSAENVYDNGVTLSSLADFSANLSTGTVTKVIRPAGTMTLDGKGAAPGGVWLSSAADIARDVVCRWGPLADPDDLDTSSFTALNVDAGYRDS